MSSILTNNGAMVALQTMKMINKDLGNIQDMISTGKKVADAKDNAAVWAISTVMESDVSSFKAVGDSLALGQSTVSVARNASEQVTDLLEEMKAKIVASQEENVDRSKIQDDITALRDQIKSVVGAAQFNGLSLLKGSEDVNILASLDRSSNGTVTTSEIAVTRNNLDSGVANVAGTDGVISGTAAGTADFAGSVASADLGQFTDGVTTVTFGGSNGLDQADNATLTLDDGSGNSVILTYSGATGTASELATAYEEAFDAWQADNTALETGNVAITFGGDEATITSALSTVDIANPSDGNTLVVTDQRNRGGVQIGVALAANDIAASDMAAAADGADDSIAASATEAITLTAANGLGEGDTFALALTKGGETVTLTYTAETGGVESADDVADGLRDAMNSFLGGDGSLTSYEASNGSTVAITHSSGGAASLAAFAGITFADGGVGAIDVTNTAGSALTMADTLTSTRGTNNDLVIDQTNFTEGTVATDGSITFAVAGTATAGEEYSISIEGLSDPVVYTAQTSQTSAQIGDSFAAEINTALSDAGLSGDFEAVSDGSGTITLTNYSSTANTEVSGLSVSVPDADAAEVLDSEGNAATTIAADEEITFSFGARDVNEGDTYNIKFGTTDVTYVAGKNDELADVVTNLSGLIKVSTNDNVSFENSDGEPLEITTDPTTGAISFNMINSGTTDITGVETSVTSGGTVNGGLNSIDQIDVSTNLKAEGSLEIIDSLIQTAIDASADFGSSEKRLEIQQEFISKLTDSLTSGIGTLVDANMEETAARLQALQVQQQLGTQALSIANQAPQNILALFR